jgi:hypothetical protein
MPKVEIDYSNTIIYKITCKDPSISDVYVGHTTNFVQRKHSHKQSCVKEQCKLYTTIRNNGGWDNWTMEIVSFFNCNDHYEARIKEQEYFELLHATLNSIEPMPKPKSKVKPSQAVEILTQNTPPFTCEKCEYHTDKKSNYYKHIKTEKHKLTNAKYPINNEPISTYICSVCEKKYLSRTGLWKHKKTCKPKEENKPNSLSDKELIVLLINEHKEMQNFLIEQSKKHNEEHNEMKQFLIEQSKNHNEFKNMIINLIKEIIPSKN